MIRTHIDVAVPVDRAFAVWTDKVDLWWPRNHRLSRRDDGRMTLEANEGGRLFEATPDGSEFDYGRVLRWSPPHELVLAFFLGSGAAAPSEVRVAFLPQAQGTRVEVTHLRGELSFEAFAAIADRFEGNWPKLNAAFATTVTSSES